MATFVDNVTLHLRAGNGGDGCASIRREKFKPLAGPDGGAGGNGGDIVLVADPQVTTLLGHHRHPHQTAEHGGDGMGDYRNGATGTTLELSVPVGTVVKDEFGRELVDLNVPGMSFVAESGSGHAFVMDGAPEAGGRNLGPRPMEMVLAGTGGCTAFDIVLILKKGRHAVSGCEVIFFFFMD